MTKILFTYYPLFVRFNHGAALLTAICKSAGIGADYAPCSEIEKKLPNYDVIGFSFVTDADYEKSVPYVQMCKAAGKKVIAGGVYARRGGRIEGIDQVCRGEAEDFIVEYLNGDDQAFKPEYIRPGIDDLPLPDLSQVCGNEFDRGQWFLKGKRIIPYQSSRGCFWGKCSFCEVLYQEREVRIKHTIADDIQFLKKTYNPDLIYLMDTTIPYCVPEWKEQWEKVYTPFQGYIRADIDPDNLKFLIDHGLKATAFGIESADENFRNETLHKGLTDKQLASTIEILQRNGVFYIPFFMLGVPGEPPDSKEKMGKMFRKAKGYPMIWKYQDLSKNIEIKIQGGDR
jgi:radical SAM superfamily enzyme YgiQ (UPF0313 family)